MYPIYYLGDILVCKQPLWKEKKLKYRLDEEDHTVENISVHIIKTTTITVTGGDNIVPRKLRIKLISCSVFYCIKTEYIDLHTIAYKSL